MIQATSNTARIAHFNKSFSTTVTPGFSATQPTATGDVFFKGGEGAGDAGATPAEITDALLRRINKTKAEKPS
ncbi:MAG: hypothetical protein VKJ04_09265 [Vampirovibrionales bacterium]|nr:hypothetical protein [Vampirovibrionales bacterium]